MKHSILIGAISMALFSCTNSEEQHSVPPPPPPATSFVGAITLNDSTTVGFPAYLRRDTLFITNGPKETVTVALQGTDTLRGTFPVFASDLWLIKTDSGYFGQYYRTDVAGYTLPLSITPGVLSYTEAQSDWPGQYRITRTYNDGVTRPALLQLSKNDGVLAGTIATSTGDSRFLTGWETAEGFTLQGFDGRFIYRIEASVQGDRISGNVWSGKTGYYSFEGEVDEDATLENPEEMSRLREDYTHVEWHLPGLDGDTVHFDSRTITKPTILAIQGSWCPNCMDEGRVLDLFYREFEGDIDVFGLSYEYSGTLEKATAAVRKMERDLGTSFPMVIATYDPKQDRNAVLPLEKIRSYPTSILLDHTGNVVKIHTGFYGPSTKEYDAYVHETRETLQTLVAAMHE